MISMHHKRRWVMSPLRADGQPLVSEYSVACHWLHLHEGKVLACCEFNAQGLIAARACPDLYVWGSLHSTAPIHDEVADHYSGHGLKRAMTPHDALVALAKLHPSFEPEV